MKKITLFVLFLSCNLFSQNFIQSYADVANQTSQANITAHLTEFENLGVKRRGTQPLEDTYNWLRNEYISYGYVAGQLQEDTYLNAGFTCKNLIVTKVGSVYPNTYVIICGHYDTIVGTGTNDNGSGTVSILEVARLLQNIDTEYSIKFIHFSGEEDGLVGSNHYVNNVVNATTPKMEIKLVFNLDEVGGIAGITNNTITCERDTGSPTSNNAASNTVTNELITCVGLYSPLNTNLSYAYASDYMPFEDNNEVITGFYETNESSHPHSSTDLLVNMDPVYNYNVAKAAVGAMLHFAIATTSLSNSSFDNDFNISFFPNPTKDYLSINFGEFTGKNTKVSIYDINGKRVEFKQYSSPKIIEVLDFCQFEKGIYLVQMKSDGKEISRKIVKN